MCACMCLIKDVSFEELRTSFSFSYGFIYFSVHINLISENDKNVVLEV